MFAFGPGAENFNNYLGKTPLTNPLIYGIIITERRKENKTMRIAIGTLFTISIIFCAWFTISYIDILAHNLSSGELADWNFFEMLINGRN